MRMDKKTLALPMVILIALSIIGLGVAHWTDQVTIEGTVKMGTLSLAFKDTLYESYEYKRTAEGLDPTEGGKPWVCNTTYSFAEFVEDEHTGKKGYKKLFINITNAYPCYEVHQTFIVRNLGLLPADIIAFNITETCQGLVWKQGKDPNYPGRFFGDLVDNKTGMEIPIINLNMTDDLPIQLHFCSENKMEIDLHIKQEALECHTYCIVVEILYTQPN